MTTVKHFLGMAAASSVLILTACAANPRYSLLDREATAADALPSSIAESEADIDVDTSRFVGVDDGVFLWLVAPDGDNGICLVLSPNKQDWQVACSAGALQVEMESGIRYAVYPDGMPSLDGMRQISENVFAFAD